MCVSACCPMQVCLRWRLDSRQAGWETVDLTAVRCRSDDGNCQRFLGLMHGRKVEVTRRLVVPFFLRLDPPAGAELLRMRRLERVDLYASSAGTNRLINNWGRMPQLTTLRCACDRRGGRLSLDGLVGCRGLVNLSLCDVKLGSSLASWLTSGAAGRLCCLQLDACTFEWKPSMFVRATHLHTLALGTSSLNDAALAIICSETLRLERLDVSFSRVSDLFPLRRLLHLREVLLRCTRCTDDTLKHLSACPRLVHVTLDCDTTTAGAMLSLPPTLTSLADGDRDVLKRVHLMRGALPSLRRLELHNFDGESSTFNSELCQAVSRLSTVDTLSLNLENGVDGIDLSPLASMPSLTALYISNVWGDDAAPKKIFRLLGPVVDSGRLQQLLLPQKLRRRVPDSAQEFERRCGEANIACPVFGPCDPIADWWPDPEWSMDHVADAPGGSDGTCLAADA